MRNANTSRYQIRKNSGELATFSAEKLRRSLLKSGAGVEVAENVLREVSRELYDGITTREIYRKAFNLLHGHGSHFACRYSLKKVIYEMGPSGFPFEKLVGYIFQKKNYKVQWNQVLQGRCVTHEVDLVLEKDRKTAFVECKFHSEEGRNCDVKVPLYIHSRFEDISQRSGAQKYSGWVVTNTRFTLDALEYGNCVGLSLLSWDYPKAKGLKDLADQFKIYPITVSSLLSAEEKQSLLEKGHVLASEILQYPELLQKEKISTERKERIIKELQKIMHHENGKIEVHFLGAAGTVTGSKFLVETPGCSILIDCGFFQGLKDLRLKNWEDLPVNVPKIDYVLLTHGHLDHVGYLPRLVMQGFKGKILGNAPTLEIAEIILKDTAKIQEEEAEKANKEDFSKHQPALPLYDLEDVERTIQAFETVHSGEWISLRESIRFRHQLGGHILGAGFIELEIDERRLVFSGDIGRNDDLLLQAPNKPKWADVLFLESTYGNRLHLQENVEELLKTAVLDIIAENGILLIACFAVERLQLLSFLLWKLFRSNKIPNLPVYVDSPMGTDVTKLFAEYHEYHKLSTSEFSSMSSYFEQVSSYRRTWEIIDENRPRIVLAGSGMLTGGRILTYLTRFLEVPSTRLMLTGFQAEGTRGRDLLEGAREIKIWGKYYQVKAQILKLESLSAHADQAELMEWCTDIRNIPEQVFLIHGEEPAAAALKLQLAEHYGWFVSIPSLNQKIQLFP